MKFVYAAVALLALAAPAHAQSASISEQCAGAFSRLADPGTGTVDAQDAADLLGDEFVGSQGDLSQSEFMEACQSSRETSTGAGGGESGRSSRDGADK